jgi:hypothetical protein
VPVREMQGVPNSQLADHSVHVGGNPEAAKAAIERVQSFLATLPAVTP